ncbi:hypothetical protein C8R46DRAFT_1167478 [Mycena filopes]|nr:hypothetical protein C8R46DRAFT_1167478 [Mycena filopes]
MSKLAVSLKPSSGFCIKSSCLQPAVLKVAATVPPGPNSLEPRNTSIAVPANRKIFINFAWDAQVPPPPEGNEEAIQRAMHGEDEHLNPDAWFVPVIVSEPRQDTDKSGNPCLVFDCIFHSSIRSQLGLQRIEAQTSLVLSRQISVPNIASKGKLLPRTAYIPSSLSTATAANAPLIEEIESIISPSVAAGAVNLNKSDPQATRALIPRTTLDLEPKRIILAVPAHPPLDIDFGAPDAQIVAMSRHAALMLKRERALDVDGATAEWRVADSLLVLTA